MKNKKLEKTECSMGYYNLRFLIRQNNKHTLILHGGQMILLKDRLEKDDLIAYVNLEDKSYGMQLVCDCIIYASEQKIKLNYYTIKAYLECKYKVKVFDLYRNRNTKSGHPYVSRLSLKEVKVFDLTLNESKKVNSIFTPIY